MIATILASMFICALAFGGGAYLWIACRRQDELDARARREIERATHAALSEPEKSHIGRRAA